MPHSPQTFHFFCGRCLSSSEDGKRSSETTTRDGNNLPTRHDKSVSFGEQTAVVSNPKNEKTLSATDVLAPTTMKNAAKCDTSCELRNPVSHQNFERILHFPRGVCLLECLFIPTSPCMWLLAPAAGLPWSNRWSSSRRDGNGRGLRASFILNTTVRLRPMNNCLRRHDVTKLSCCLLCALFGRRRFIRNLIIRSDLQSVKNTR